MDYNYETYKGLRVAWTPELDGGGRQLGQQFLRYFDKRIGKAGRVFELCAGPGFVGFSLLAHRFCDSLCLSDVNPDAVKALEHTVAINGLGDRVSVYLSDSLDSIPAHERWDVAVAQPPHHLGPQAACGSLILNDPDWDIHRRFYANIRRYLKPHGQCVFLENYLGNSEETFRPLLNGTGIEFVESVMLNEGEGTTLLFNTFYFFCSRVAHAEFVPTGVSPVLEIVLRRDDEALVALVDETHRAPATLPVGQKYAFSVAGPEPSIMVDLRALSAPYSARTQVPYPTCGDGKPNPRRIIAIPTIPCAIADPRSGTELMRFE